MTTDEKIAALEAKVALFERVIRTFVETPVIRDDPQFRLLILALGAISTEPSSSTPAPSRSE